MGVIDEKIAGADSTGSGFFSLRTKLPVFVGLLLLALICAYAIISYTFARQSAVEIGQERIDKVTRQMSSIFARSAAALAGMHAQLAKNENVQALLDTASYNNRKDSGMAVLRRSLADEMWVSAQVLSREGMVLHREGSPDQLKLLSKQILPDLLLTKPDSVLIGNLIYADSFLYYPIVSGLAYGGNQQGFLVRWRQQRTSAQALEQFYLLLGEGSNILIGNSDGTLWTDLNKAIKAPNLNRKNPLAITESIPGTSWQLHIALSEKQVLGLVNASLKWLIFVGIALFVVGAIFAWLISRSITRPIFRLTDAAAKVAAGNLSTEVDQSGKDELAVLATSFNSMVEKLRSAYQKQEEVVQLRTRQLEERLVELKASESRFKDLLEATPDATVIVDAAGDIQFVNRQTEVLFGYQRSELLGQPVDKLIPSNFRATHTLHMQGYVASPLARGMGTGLEIFAQKKDGSQLPVEISLAPIKAQGKLLITAAIRDISERKKAEEAIRDINRELESFTYSVSHDLRAPLRIIDGYADILEEDHASQLDAEGRRFLKVIKSNARRMGQLIDDLLDLSRTGRKGMEFEKVDMQGMVQEIVEEMEQVKELNAHIQIGELPEVKADGSLIRQVWINLISNAVKYSSRGQTPHIRIMATKKPGAYEFSVSDNGVGFDMSYSGKLFGVFQRLHNDADFEGTGIGLALVARIIKRHGGRIWADARPGEGATFTFNLPIT